MERVIQYLRSPWLAIALIAATSVYAALAASVPGWAERGFASPVFAALCGALALCTLVCAVERTRVAVRTLRAGATAPSALLSAPHAGSAPLAAESADEALDAASRELRTVGLRVRRSDGGLVASANAWGALGSPVFHWALVLLFFAVAGGRLTRAEGAIDLPLGRFVTDESPSYLPGAVE
ncbi:MAG: cytochrome c biogenesis protein ResB, partial [Actinobacteria bacterium]